MRLHIRMHVLLHYGSQTSAACAHRAAKCPVSQAGGAWGTEAEEFLKESKKVAEHCRNGIGDLSHWSAMNWGGHWRQRIGVEIARGLARCIERAAMGGRVEGSSARSRSQEWDPSCC